MARGGHSAIVYLDEHMYIFGGVGKDGFLNDMWKFDLQVEDWTPVLAFVSDEELDLSLLLFLSIIQRLIFPFHLIYLSIQL